MTDIATLPVDEALSALLDEVARRVAVSMRTTVPATVLSFARTPRAEVSVSVGIQAVLRSGEAVTIPQIDRVPVLWPGGGGWVIDADLVPGEQVMLTVFDRDISRWLDDGGPVPPASGVLHPISSSACQAVSLRSIKQVAAATPGVGQLLIGRASGDAPWLRMASVPPSATLEAPAISLGDGATLGVARLTDAVTPDAAWLTWFASVATALNGLGVPVPTPIPPAGVPWARISGASAIVRAK